MLPDGWLGSGVGSGGAALDEGSDGCGALDEDGVGAGSELTGVSVLAGVSTVDDSETLGTVSTLLLGSVD